MPVFFNFRDLETHEVLVTTFDPDDVCGVGEAMALCGRRVVRLSNRSPSFQVPAVPMVRKWDVKGYSLPAWAPGAEGYDADGTPCFSSEASVAAFCDESARRAEKDPGETAVTYDRDWGGQWQDSMAQKRGGSSAKKYEGG